MTDNIQRLLSRLNTSLVRMIGDLKIDKNYVSSNLNDIKDVERLNGWHDSVLPTIENWRKEVEKAEKDYTYSLKENFKSTLSGMQSIYQGFDDTFDWSNSANKIKIGRSLVPNIAKQILLLLYDKTPSETLMRDSKVLENEWVELSVDDNNKIT